MSNAASTSTSPAAPALADRLAALRALATSEVEQHDWPKARDEAWRYTSLRGLRDGPAVVHDGAIDPVGADADPLAALATALAFDLHLDGDMLRPGSAVAAGVRAVGLGAALSDAGASDAVSAIFGAVAPVRGEGAAVIARNTSRWLDAPARQRGLALDVAAGTVVSTPLRLAVHAARAGAASAPRSVIHLGAGASLVLVEVHLGGDATPHVPVVEVALQDGAHLRHVVVAATSTATAHLASVAVRVGRDARYDLHTVLLGGATSRIDCQVDLAGSGAQCDLRGAWSAAGRQHHDVHVVVDHSGQHTQSNQLFKGLCDDRASSVFRGNVRILRSGRFASARQLNRNLLLSDGARAYGKPQLEIDNEDVKASHGSTTGQLDPGQLFYLCARGLSPDQARQLLIGAFLAEILDAVPDRALTSTLRALLGDRLGLLLQTDDEGAPEEAR